MPSSDEKRKGLRATLPAEFYFNLLGSVQEYTRGQASVLRRLGAIDSLKTNLPETTDQIFLSKIDQKLSLLIGMIAEKSSRKSYTSHGIVIDISEFGLSFAHSLDISMDTILEIGLQLPGSDQRLMDIAGQVVHVENPPDTSSSFAHVYGIEFTNIQGKDQNAIVQWIFSHQREQIRRRRERL